jgi:hypothetical protein
MSRSPIAVVVTAVLLVVTGVPSSPAGSDGTIDPGPRPGVASMRPGVVAHLIVERPLGAATPRRPGGREGGTRATSVRGVDPSWPADAPVVGHLRIEGEVGAAPAERPDRGPGAGATEPVVAPHPTDPDVMAVAYTRAIGDRVGGVGLRLSLDGGRTWHETPTQPWAGSGRVPSLHSAVAWGPGPEAPLYWVGTTTASGGGDLRIAVARSDDLGRSWSRPYVPRDTPAWVGGFPDIAVDTDPSSPTAGTVYVAYNRPLVRRSGSGIRLLASLDAGRSWHAIDVPPARTVPGYPATWRFAPRVQAGPAGMVYVSAYQADLRRWDPRDVFDRGGSSNVGRIGITVTRLRIDPVTGDLAAEPTILATTLPVNGLTAGRVVAPGTRSHTYLDPMWSHGLAWDAVGRRLFLAVGDVGGWTEARARGVIRVGRSDDDGGSWTWADVPQLSVDGRRQASFRPTIVARGPLVVVGLRSIDDVAPADAKRTDASLGTAVAVSLDGARTFAAPMSIGTRWQASTLATAVNGPGLRERIDRLADGRIVFAYGDAGADEGPTVTGDRRVVVTVLGLVAERLDRSR